MGIALPLFVCCADIVEARCLLEDRVFDFLDGVGRTVSKDIPLVLGMFAVTGIRFVLNILLLKRLVLFKRRKVICNG